MSMDGAIDADVAAAAASAAANANAGVAEASVSPVAITPLPPGARRIPTPTPPCQRKKHRQYHPRPRQRRKSRRRRRRRNTSSCLNSIIRTSWYLKFSVSFPPRMMLSNVFLRIMEKTMNEYKKEVCIVEDNRSSPPNCGLMLEIEISGTEADKFYIQRKRRHQQHPHLC